MCINLHNKHIGTYAKSKQKNMSGFEEIEATQWWHCQATLKNFKTGI